MLQLKLTAEPIGFDEHNQPRFPIRQVKGLIESQGNHLLEGALADGYTASVSEALRTWVKREVSFAARERKVDLLEIGGGKGAFFDWVKESARTYINVEPGQLVLGRKALERVSDPMQMCIKCSAEGIPLEDESVDVILSIASFDHIPDYRKSLGEVRRLLRKNGLFILTLNNRRSWWKLILSRTEYLRRREEEIAREHYFQWSFADCKSNLSEFLNVMSIQTTTFLPFVPTVWRYLLPPMDLVGKIALPEYGANIIAVCQKTS